MPIRPELKHHYEGEAWESARRLVLRRAENRCECRGECGAADHQGYCCGRRDRTEYVNEKGRTVFVVLTVAHLDHDPTHQDPLRLRAFCQACHLRYDAAEHTRNRMATLREQKNNLELFE